jgi:phosphoglycolate phosphatase
MMSNKYELLVFDWDGTIMDSAGIIVLSIEAACAEMGIASPERDRIRHIIGLGFDAAMAFILPDLDKNHYEIFVKHYRKHVHSHDEDLALFDGAADTIKVLNQLGYTLAVATGKNRATFDKELQLSGLTPFFHGSRCADETMSKPHPAMLLDLMKTLSFDSSQTLVIGDTTHDLQMARNANVAAIAVTFGAHPKEELAKLAPIACVDDFFELRTWLTNRAPSTTFNDG